MNLSADIATEGESGELASVDAILVQMPNVNLNGRVVLWSDQPVCGRAASKHHKILAQTLKIITTQTKQWYKNFNWNKI